MIRDRDGECSFSVVSAPFFGLFFEGEEMRESYARIVKGRKGKGQNWAAAKRRSASARFS